MLMVTTAINDLSAFTDLRSLWQMTCEMRYRRNDNRYRLSDSIVPNSIKS